MNPIEYIIERKITLKEKRIILNDKETPYLVRDDGTIYSEKRNRILKGTLARNEYPTIYLTQDNKQYNLMVHRLVAEYFVPNPNNYTIVHHKNGNKLDCRAENLEWVNIQINNAARNRKKSEGTTYAQYWDNSLQQFKEIPYANDYLINEDGIIVNSKTLRIIKGSYRNGYLRVNINKKMYSIHILVYETFIGPVPKGYVIDHINGIKDDNRLENLRAVPQSDNMSNAFLHGHKGQIKISQYDKNKNLIKTYSSIQEAADAMGVTHAAIRSAADREGTSCGYYWKKEE